MLCAQLGRPAIFIFSGLEMSSEEDASLAASRMDRFRVGRGDGQLNLAGDMLKRAGLSQHCELLHAKDLCL